jgi:putative tryptophan/tyrosine transport system substrate-binding protein
VKRREFITLLAGATVSLLACPLAAGAQPAPGKWKIGFLFQEDLAKPIREGLRELGYVEGQNLTTEFRHDHRAERLPALAAELIALKPDIIAAGGTQAAQAAHGATKTIPIVFVASNPVGNGLVASLRHPGGNATGLSLQSPELSGKRLELLYEVCGKPSAIAVLLNPDDPPAANALRETMDASSQKGLQATVVDAHTPDEIAPGFEKIVRAAPGALIILTSVLMSAQVNRIAELALRAKLPSIYATPQFPKAGGLMSYGPNFDTIRKRLAIYIDKIFKGANPADLPVEQPTKFELVINVTTARAIGLTVPPTLLAIADEVID